MRRLREEGTKIGRRDERRDVDRHKPEAEQADRGRVRGPGQGRLPRRPPHGEEGRDLAVRPVRRGRPPVRGRGLRQEGPRRIRPERERLPRLACQG